MLCPSCKKALVIVEVRGVELDTCIDGHGIWFDVQELRQLFELAGLPDELLDLESELQALRHHGARRHCPRCTVRMQHVAGPGEAKKIILDQCPRGDGLWFDEGELMALLACLLGKEDDALDRVRDYLGHVAGPALEKKDEA